MLWIQLDFKTASPKPPSTSGPEQSSTTISVNVTPEQVQPYPKAKPRVLSGRGSKKGSTKILTDTPVKRQIEEHEAKRKDKKAQWSLFN